MTPPEMLVGPFEQATDLDGDTAFVFSSDGSLYLRVRRAGGALTPAEEIAPVPDGVSLVQLVVDDDGGGVVMWDQDDGPTGGNLQARRFSQDGELRRLVQVVPDDHLMTAANLAIRPTGTAVISWSSSHTGDSVPYVRVFRVGNGLGAVTKIAALGGAASIAMERSGRATLVFANNYRGRYVARRFKTDGTLTPTQVLRSSAYRDERLQLFGLGIDRRGVITVACERWSRPTPTPDDYLRACVFRISPDLEVMEPVRDVSPDNVYIDSGLIEVAVARNGNALVGWQKNPNDGAFVRPLRPDGSLAPNVKVSNGGIGDISLRGDGDGGIVSEGYVNGGESWRIRITKVKNGVPGSTHVIGTVDSSSGYQRVAARTRGRLIVTWIDQVAEQIMLVAGD